MFSDFPHFRARLVALALVTCTQVPSSQERAAPADRPLVIRNVRIFDGSRVLEARDIVVADGRIAALGTELEAPGGARHLNGAGCTLLPGLIDCHTHVLARDMLRQALVHGVTTELDMFMDWKLAREIKRAQAEGKLLDLADLRSAGTLVTAPGGHGTEYGVPIPTITSPDEAQAFVDARIEEGSDFIKLVYDTGESYGISYPSIDKATLAAVVAAAHARGKTAVVHISTLQSARDAIEVGADGIVHLFFEDVKAPNFGRLLAEHHAFVIPTLTVLEGVSGVPSGAAFTDKKFAPYLSASALINLKQSFPALEGAKESFAATNAAIAILRDAGVPILAGSDVPNPGTAHGISIHRELELLVAAGLTPIEALAGATSKPAALFGLSQRGRIEVGLRADLLLVKGDPTRDITATRDIVGVWKLGTRVDRQAYREALAHQSTAGTGTEVGLVSDFETGEVSSEFGAGWSVSTDALRGGRSTALLEVTAGGAEGSEYSLSITGTIVAGSETRWAGVVFSPGSAPMTPTNLSSKEGVSFWARGEEKSYYIMLFLQSAGFTPVVNTFKSSKEWQRFSFSFEDFNGSDGSDVMGVYFGAGADVGDFAFEIDTVWFE